MQEVIRFQPLYQDRVWGGRVLETALGRTLPREGPIGESWEVVDRPEAQSVISDGPWKGLSIREALAGHAAEIMGPDWPADRPFPILIKWLDCRERLSLQVHPPAEIAPAMGGEPKTENWYIAESTPDANLIVGLKAGATRADFAAALVDHTLESCVHRFPVSPGDSILVQSGTIHAIDGGNLILEIQQNSDTTYRVYDWGRVGLDGTPRQLHIAESIASIDWEVVEPEPVRAAAEDAVIASSQEFTIRRVPMAAGATLSFAAGEQARLVSVVTGEVSTGGKSAPLTKGENALLPYAGAFTLTAVTDAMVLVTENFA
ncbi:type I phosphomannose isomerase catalytic subunit [Synoicihabitans lomoniglobus]|uniref:Class I mannose-6-phosphate isomerase n=1 Tax=Synoicihabitans lomoniglobus TaxID=2909285 RepID=A0AAE9ZW53_9BACT|nr:class I mannose-6-phosphate isomerase [Opitutaceae bacterium LMO-M01]WED63985.1 class I mannose-6-phosphate isomerase [Opitutaceae bacterium LMO-M01]